MKLPSLVACTIIGVGLTTSAVKADSNFIAPGDATKSLYAQGTASLYNAQQSPIAIPSLSLTLPGLSRGYKFAIVTLNAPNAYGNDCTFSIWAGGVEYASGHITNTTNNTIYIPITVVTKIPLSAQPRALQAEWNGNNNDACQLDTFYSLSAIVTTT